MTRRTREGQNKHPAPYLGVREVASFLGEASYQEEGEYPALASAYDIHL